jgi:hypothetical protein
VLRDCDKFGHGVQYEGMDMGSGLVDAVFVEEILCYKSRRVKSVKRTPLPTALNQILSTQLRVFVKQALFVLCKLSDDGSTVIQCLHTNNGV